MDEQMNKIWYVHNVLNRKEILTPATMWMKLMDIVSSEKKPDTKEKILYGSTYMMFLESSSSLDVESRIVISGARRSGELLFNEYGVSV